jgi:hypothetical protein
VTLPTTCTSIGDYSFSGCKSLYTMGETIGTITIPTNVTSIGNYAFRNCTSINIVNAPSSSLTSVGANAFGGCVNMTSITLSSGLPSYTDIVPNTSITYQQYWGIPPSCQITQ